MTMLDGKKVAEARRRKDWTQVELSEATKPKVDVSTISRIERGKPMHARKNTMMALAKALEVQPQDLCRAPEAERDVMKISINTAARNALELVAFRYSIRRDRIIEIAPLLFFIIAEQSLKERQRCLDALSDATYQMDKIQAAILHLPPTVGNEYLIASEQRSIKARDLFGEKVQSDPDVLESHDFYDEDTDNPLAKFLSDCLKSIDTSGVLAKSVRWPPGWQPSYEICNEEAALVVGDDKSAVHAILCGAAGLHEMPKGSLQQRAEWARAEFDRKYADILKFVSDRINGPVADQDASESGDGQ